MNKKKTPAEKLAKDTKRLKPERISRQPVKRAEGRSDCQQRQGDAEETAARCRHIPVPRPETKKTGSSQRRGRCGAAGAGRAGGGCGGAAPQEKQAVSHLQELGPGAQRSPAGKLDYVCFLCQDQFHTLGFYRNPTQPWRTAEPEGRAGCPCGQPLCFCRRAGVSPRQPAGVLSPLKRKCCYCGFFKVFIYLFYTEGKGRRKRGRETSVCGCLSYAPYWGPGPQPRHVP